MMIIRETGKPIIPRGNVLFLILIITILSAFMPSVRLKANDVPSSGCSLNYGFDTEILNDVELKDAKATIEFWITEFTSKASMQAQTKLYHDSAMLIEDFKAGKIDMASTSSLTYLELEDYADTANAYISVQNNVKTNRYVLLVRANSSIRNLAGLKGKRLTIKDGGNIGRKYLDALLASQGFEPADKFFKTITPKMQYSQAVLSVFFGQADAVLSADTSFATMSELNPQVGKQLRVLAESPPFIPTVTFFSRRYDPAAKAKFIATMNGIKDTQYGRQFTLLFKFDRLEQLKAKDLNTLRTLRIQPNEKKRRTR